MSIIYSLIAREDTESGYGENIHVLVEQSLDVVGNFPQITRQEILKKVPKNDRSIYKYKEKYIYHTINEDSFTYLCLTDASYPKRTAMNFLEDIKKTFNEKYSFDERIKAITFKMNDSFGNILANKMKYYNQNSLDPRMARIKNEAQATLGIMEGNLESVNERGEKLELLVKSTNTLNIESSGLKGRATALKDKQRKEWLLRSVIIGAVAVVIIYFVFFR